MFTDSHGQALRAPFILLTERKQNKEMKQNKEDGGKDRKNPSHWEVWKQNALSVGAKCELYDNACKGEYQRQRNLKVVFLL